MHDLNANYFISQIKQASWKIKWLTVLNKNVSKNQTTKYPYILLSAPDWNATLDNLAVW